MEKQTQKTTYDNTFLIKHKNKWNNYLGIHIYETKLLLKNKVVINTKFRIVLPLGVKEVRGKNWEEQIYECKSLLLFSPTLVG